MDVYILDTVRTPRGKAKPTGGLASCKPIELLRQLYHALEERNHLEPSEVDDVILGCVTQTREQGTNIARVSVLYAGWPEQIPATTISTYCASGLSSVGLAATQIHAGISDLMVAGGVESISRVPMLSDKGPLFEDPEVTTKTGGIFMGISADLVASMEGYTRDELDTYAVQTHQRAAYARDHGYFAPSLVPIVGSDGNICLDHDEFIRADTSVEGLARFDPVFEEMGQKGQDAIALQHYPEAGAIQHLHHRGNSNGMADGAGLVLLGTPDKARALGLPCRARIRAVAHHAVDPVIMLTAIVGASEKALAQAGLTTDDIDLFEVYESFSAVVLKYQRHFSLDNEIFNVNGGAIAMGHAFGATGAMMLTVLLDEMERRDVSLGLVTVCGAAGLGIAMILERNETTR